MIAIRSVIGDVTSEVGGMDAGLMKSSVASRSRSTFSDLRRPSGANMLWSRASAMVTATFGLGFELCPMARGAAPHRHEAPLVGPEDERHCRAARHGAFDRQGRPWHQVQQRQRPPDRRRNSIERREQRCLPQRNGEESVGLTSGANAAVDRSWNGLSNRGLMAMMCSTSSRRNAASNASTEPEHRPTSDTCEIPRVPQHIDGITDVFGGSGRVRVVLRERWRDGLSPRPSRSNRMATSPAPATSAAQSSHALPGPTAGDAPLLRKITARVGWLCGRVVTTANRSVGPNRTAS